MGFEFFNKRGEKKPGQEKDCLMKIRNFVEDRLSETPNWRMEFSGRLDSNHKKFKEMLDQFILWYDEKFPGDPLNFKKTFNEGDALREILKTLFKEAEEKKKDREKTSSRSEQEKALAASKFWVPAPPKKKK